MSCGIPNVIFTGSARRREAIEEARQRGRDGWNRPGDDLLMPGGLSASDTYVGELINSFEDGRDERAAAPNSASSPTRLNPTPNAPSADEGAGESLKEKKSC